MTTATTALTPPPGEGWLGFTLTPPAALAGDPDACAEHWAQTARARGLVPLGRPTVLHTERVVLPIGGRERVVCDDASPVEAVTGEVTLTSTRR